MYKVTGKKKLFTGILAFMFIMGFMMGSCKKEEETIGVVQVNDSLGNGVAGASVRLFQDTAVNQTTGATANVDVTQTTDGSGRCEFPPRRAWRARNV